MLVIEADVKPVESDIQGLFDRSGPVLSGCSEVCSDIAEPPSPATVEHLSRALAAFPL